MWPPEQGRPACDAGSLLLIVQQWPDRFLLSRIFIDDCEIKTPYKVADFSWQPTDGTWFKRKVQNPGLVS
jgi:hypothetical protein